MKLVGAPIPVEQSKKVLRCESLHRNPVWWHLPPITSCFAATRRASDRHLKKIDLLFFKSGRGMFQAFPVAVEYSINSLGVGVESVNVGARVRTIAGSPFIGAA